MLSPLHLSWKGLSMRRLSSFAIGIALLIIAADCVARAQNGTRHEIGFTVSMPSPHTHLFDVEMRIQDTGTITHTQEVLVMPVWQPGSYLIREFERHVQDFAATDDSGHPLVWEKINKNSWRVMTPRIRSWRVSYRVYANELSVRTSEL